MAVADMRKRFAAVLVATGDTDAAARESGIDVATALRDVAVQRAMRDAFQRRLLQVAPVALNILVELMTNEDMPAAIRRLAASDILDRVGLVSQAALGLAKPIESLSEMPARELRALVERLETELFARATPVRELELAAPAQAPHNILD